MVSTASHIDLADVLVSQRALYSQEDLIGLHNEHTYVHEDPSSMPMFHHSSDDQRKDHPVWLLPTAGSSNVGELEDFFDWGAAGFVDFDAELHGAYTSIKNSITLKSEDPMGGDAALVKHIVPSPCPPMPAKEDSGCSSVEHQHHSTQHTTAMVNTTSMPVGNLLHMLPIINAPPPPPPCGHHVDSSDATSTALCVKLARAASIQRYRAKRARRVFKKKIRYQSRKTYAEARPRIKGRFVKRDE